MYYRGAAAAIIVYDITNQVISLLDLSNPYNSLYTASRISASMLAC